MTINAFSGKGFLLLFLLLTLFSLSLDPAVGQAATGPESPGRVLEPPPVLKASEVATEAEETTVFLNTAVQRSQPRTNILTIERQLPSTEADTRRLIKKADDELESQVSLVDLRDLKNGLQRQDNLLRDLRDQLRTELGRSEVSLDELRARREVWEQTQESGRSNDYPEAVMTLIGRTLEALEEGREKISEKRSHLLSIQNLIVELRGLIQETVIKVSAAEEELLGRLFSFRGRPLWDVSEMDTGQFWPRVRGQMAKNFSSFGDYARAKLPWIFLNGFLLITASLMLRKMRRKSESRVREDSGLVGVKLVLEHPFAASAVLFVFVNMVFQPGAPYSWYKAMVLVGLGALFRLLPSFVPSQFVGFSLLLLGLRLLQLVNSQVPAGTSLGRLLTTFIICASLFSLFRFKRRVLRVESISKRWAAVFYWSSWGGILVLGIALLAGVFGNLILAGLLGGATVGTAFTAVSFWLAFSVFHGMLALGIRTGFAQKLRFIRNNRELVFGKTIRIVGVLTVLIFALSIPYAFAIYDPMISALAERLSAPLTVGALSLSLADVLAFFFLVWLSFQVSRFVCFILEEDFLPRFRLPRGVPDSISRLTYYAILFVGFVIALTAAGLDVSRVTLLAGAFGVGIGFGLQNIVNNFVSGLILLFERPVHVGDKVQLAQDLTGEVVRIGIRASVLKTFEGAEVLVPNGQLISNELTNWTLSDAKRRVTIPVGVAYGTDPLEVIGILKSLAAEHPQVLRNPAPNALFMGFGESSLDFSLRVWVASFEAGFEVRSDLNVAINKALKDAGIEIPFPQRDLHLRSVTGDVKL